jgi:UDP-2,3-diacylglucosamine hydrolase
LKRDKIYFASDLHLGAPDPAKSLKRERHFVRWLEEIRPQAQEIYLLGDVFDFWHEWKKVVPKGYVRLLGKLAEMTDEGIPIHYFMGNHDLWLKDYFPTEVGVSIHEKPEIKEWHGKTFYFAHGDGLGPGDKGYKFLRKIFTNRFLKWNFAQLHPNFGIGLANYFSRLSRKKTGHLDAVDYGDKEFLLIHTKEVLAQHPEVDYCIYGHRHYPKKQEVEHEKYYINLGDWITHFTYLEISAEGVELKTYPME